MNKYDVHNFQIELEILNNYCTMNIDISMAIVLVSILDQVQFCYKNSFQIDWKSQEIIYRLFKPVAGRNRAADGVALRSDIIEPS